MPKVFFTPGPSQLHPNARKAVKQALIEDIPSISHRGKQFQQIHENTVNSLKTLFGVPNDFHVFFLGSATEAMERILQNCVEKNSFHFVNGAFSKRFYSIAGELGKNPIKMDAKPGEDFDYASASIPKETELICFTHNETSTGTALDLRNVYKIKKKNPDKLIALDIVSSAPCVDIDFTMIDSAFFSVQKGFGLPAGLGVLIASEECVKKSKQLIEKGASAGSYHNFANLVKEEAVHQTPETPNVLGIYLLGKQCELFKEKGRKKLISETNRKAKVMYEFFDNHSQLNCFVKNKSIRSKTVVAVNTPSGNAETITKLSEKKIVVGKGYGEFKENQIRIANFPAHKLSTVKELLSCF